MSVDTGGSAGKKGAQPVINVTPLVDVVLVLLIIFMVIIPNVQDGTPIEMITVQNPDEERGAKLEPLPVTITSAEVYSIEDTDMSRAAVLRELARVRAETPGRVILLRGDARLEFSIVRSFFRDVQQLGFTRGVKLAVSKQRAWSDAGQQ